METAVLNTLKGTNWLVNYQTSGSNKVLVLNNDPTGRIGSQSIIWCEQWTGNNCQLWIVFPDIVGKGVVRILVTQVSVVLNGGKISTGTGTGTSVYGNNNPQDKTDTGCSNEQLTLTYPVPTN